MLNYPNENFLLSAFLKPLKIGRSESRNIEKQGDFSIFNEI